MSFDPKPNTGGLFKNKYKKDGDKKKNLISNESVAASTAPSSETAVSNNTATSVSKAQTDSV